MKQDNVLYLIASVSSRPLSGNDQHPLLDFPTLTCQNVTQAPIPSIPSDPNIQTGSQDPSPHSHTQDPKKVSEPQSILGKRRNRDDVAVESQIQKRGRRSSSLPPVVSKDVTVSKYIFELDYNFECSEPTLIDYMSYNNS